jgi:hypoxanthine phosphoribosyltransferase
MLPQAKTAVGGNMQSYDYTHRTGVADISWDHFAQLAATLSEQLASFQIDAVVGIARAGLFPATAVACALRRDLYPVRISRRVQDTVTYAHPLWIIDVTAHVANKRIAVIDEMADTGETLALVAQRVREQGAGAVITASLIRHSWARPEPDCVALTTDALVIFPWDKQVYQDGRWQTHPELVGALALQTGEQ